MGNFTQRTRRPGSSATRGFYGLLCSLSSPDRGRLRKLGVHGPALEVSQTVRPQADEGGFSFYCKAVPGGLGPVRCQQNIRPTSGETSRSGLRLGCHLLVPDVTVDLRAAELAFQSWELIRQQEAAQGYLFSLLFKDRS